jgi:ParB family chromosome partitioning protein
LRLLKLDPIIQTGMRDGFISMGHGRALINVDDLSDQLDIYEKILSQNLSVRDTEALVRNFKNPNEKASAQKASAPPFAKKAKKELTDLFETSVEVKVSKSGKGQLVVPFKNKEDFERILKLIKSEK